MLFLVKEQKIIGMPFHTMWHFACPILLAPSSYDTKHKSRYNPIRDLPPLTANASTAPLISIFIIKSNGALVFRRHIPIYFSQP